MSKIENKKKSNQQKNKTTKKKINNNTNKIKLKINNIINSIKAKIINIKNKDNNKDNQNKKDNIKNKIVKDNKLDYKSLTTEQIEKELKKEIYKSKYFNLLTSTVYALIIVAALAALVATLVMPVLQISGSSMTPTFYEGEIVLTVKTKNLQSGDIIAFYHGNKILVKRVIAGAGSWINITEDGSVYINGDLLNEPYIEELAQGDYDIEFPYQVPDGHWFVLGDHRTISIDSRNSEIGAISQDDIVGKIIFRIWPFKKIGNIE